jgi:crotonobetainyl-CoA:carnitine CoA-transferase CaiB-like acyl-CoA transferase
VTAGDDTRGWGPPFALDGACAPTDLSAYFMCANRNKESVAIDIRTEAGQQQIKALAADADIIVENFKPGSLRKYGLDHDTLPEAFPQLVYCSISGFGQTGPNSSKPGYDLMAQGYGGIMSLTGAPDGEPMKVGVGVADVMCGMYATVGILAALRHRDQTGEGQHIDLSPVDTQVVWLVNQGVNYLTTGNVPERHGNGHPNIAPYQMFRASDGNVIVVVGNGTQFQRFVHWLGATDLATDPMFSTNPARLENRTALNGLLEPLIHRRSVQAILDGLEAGKIPVGPVNTFDTVFASDQVAARYMKITMTTDAQADQAVDLISNPPKFSKSPVSYRRATPRFGQHTTEVLNALPKQSGPA